MEEFKQERELYGKLQEDILYNIISGNMIFLQISSQAKKNTMLKIIIKNLKRKRRIFYLDCIKIGQNPNIKKIFQKRYGIIGRIMNIKPKNMIVLLDNIHYMSDKNCEIIKYYFDQDQIKSVVFIGENYESVKLSPSIKHRIGKRIFKL